MKQVKILDCTLRDGGCVNDFNFGKNYMDTILNGVERAGVEIIELGYIDEKNGSAEGRTKFCNEQVIPNAILHSKKEGITYVAMIDHGAFDPVLLAPRTPDSIDGIRLAFHKKNRVAAIECGKAILEKGYQLFIQPMTCMRYSDVEMVEFIEMVNEQLPDATAFYIVDSFGEMRLNDLLRMANLVDHNLKKGLSIGFHSHNNLQLSYSNSVALLGFPTMRDLIFDSSIMGMGKGAGNMNTELFAEHLNIYENKQYVIAPLLEVVDTAINQIRENFVWGYAVEYYLSAAYHCTPSYAGHFYKKHMLSIDQVAELLSRLSEEKKVSFDKAYADSVYFAYNAKKYDDKNTIEAIANVVKEKTVLLVAPGKSVAKEQELVLTYAQKENVVTIALNNSPLIPVDFTFVTKQPVYELLHLSPEKLILTSNVSTDDAKGYVVNYDSWADIDTAKTDNALSIMLNLLKHLGVKNLALAGFDGFVPDVDANYYDEKLKRPVSKEQAERRNERAKSILASASADIEIKFLTNSLYQ